MSNKGRAYRRFQTRIHKEKMRNLAEITYNKFTGAWEKRPGYFISKAGSHSTASTYCRRESDRKLRSEIHRKLRQAAYDEYPAYEEASCDEYPEYEGDARMEPIAYTGAAYRRTYDYWWLMY